MKKLILCLAVMAMGLNFAMVQDSVKVDMEKVIKLK